MKKLLALLAITGMCGSAAFAEPALAGDKPELPSFTELDKDVDSYISSDESKANDWLASNFSKADTDQDGRLSPSEYLTLVKMNSQNS